MPKTKAIKLEPTELGSRATIFFLVLILGITFAIRVIYPLSSVFGLGFTNFLETDAWNRMLYAQKLADMDFGASVSFMVQNNLLFSWIVSVFGRVFPIEMVGAWLPPIMAVGVVFMVYLIGKRVFSNNVGLIGALFVSIIPSEFLHRSLLGFADHHILEVLLLVLIVYFMVRAIQASKFLSKWTILAGVCVCLYALNWKSGIYFFGLILVLAIAALLVRARLMREGWRASVLPLVAVGAVGLALYLPMGGYNQFAWFLGIHSNAALTTGEVVSTFITPSSHQTISELMPLLAPFGTFSFYVVTTNLHVFAIAFLLGLFFVWKLKTNVLVVFFAVLSLFLLAVTLNERRFLYYLTIPIGILSALALFEIGRRLKGNQVANSMVFALPLILISLPFAKNVSAVQPYQMTQEWHTALVWLKAQPAGEVSAWGDYGHWIQYVSGKEPNYLPGPGGNSIAKVFMAKDLESPKPLLDELKTTYLIVDSAMFNKWGAVAMYAGYSTPVKESFMWKLLNGQYPLYLKLLYQSDNIKIYGYAP